MHSELISMSLASAEKILQQKGINYKVKKTEDFKKPPLIDTTAVINVKEENGITVLYVCDFMCGIYNKGNNE